MRSFVRLLTVLLSAGLLGAPARAVERVRAPGAFTYKSPYDPAARPLPAKALVRLSGQGSTHAHVSDAQYKDLSLAIQTLLKKYPADQHYFIGTGRDPAPIIAALENLGGRSLAMNFPASNIVQSHGITPKLLDEYFQRLVPNAAERADILSGRRTIVLVDQSSSGKTPASLAPHFSKYFRSIGAKIKMEKVAFYGGYGSLHRGVRRIDTTQFPDVDRYLYSPYEGVVSEFPRHELGNADISELKQRPQYVRFKQAVLDRMKRDQGLHDFLMKEGGTAFVKETKAERASRLAAETEATALAARAEQEKHEAHAAEAHALPAKLDGELAALVAKLPETQDKARRSKLSSRGQKIADWLKSALAARASAAMYSAKLKEVGPNLVVEMLLDRVEAARAAGKLSDSDHRHLIAHALGAAEMDPQLLSSLAGRFKRSEAFRDEITKGIDFFLEKPSSEYVWSPRTGYSRQVAPPTKRTAASYKALLGVLLAGER